MFDDENKPQSFDNRNMTVVFNNGRRGEPLPGCDCMRCFGYCMIDSAAASRETAPDGPDVSEEVAP